MTKTKKPSEHFLNDPNVKQLKQNKEQLNYETVLKNENNNFT